MLCDLAPIIAYTLLGASHITHWHMLHILFWVFCVARVLLLGENDLSIVLSRLQLLGIVAEKEKGVLSFLFILSLLMHQKKASREIKRLTLVLLIL